MNELLVQVQHDAEAVVLEWIERDDLKATDVFVIGCSTSEVAGQHIGTSGSEEIAAILFKAFDQLRKEKQIDLAYQCCEHLNRALVMDRSTQMRLGLDEVTVRPARNAGGAMATYAFEHFTQAVVVEEVKAHAGIDIGDTMIGMHLKQVAVPLRFQQKSIGSAHITLATTRPKLIGGERACYPK